MAITDKLSAIANQIRTLCGSTDKLNMEEMANNINDANNEINDQTELIAQIISALDAKTPKNKHT